MAEVKEKKAEKVSLTTYWRYETSSANMRVTSIDEDKKMVKLALLGGGGVVADAIVGIEELFEHVEKLKAALKKK